MFLIPTISALFTFLYLRPHEVFELLRPVTLAPIVMALALAYVLDLRLGFARPSRSPVFAPMVAFFGLCVLSLAIKAPGVLSERVNILSASLLAFVFVAQGLQSLRAVAAGAAVLFALSVVLTVVGVLQGLSSPVCFLRNPGNAVTAAKAVEGLPCTTTAECLEAGPGGVEFFCEHPGVMGTRSIGLRVRYRGVLEDPNELSMAISMGVPLCFAFYGRRRSKVWLAVMLATIAASFVCVVMTASRSGQLSMLAMLGVYFIRRFGKKGVAAAVIAGLPLLVLGGRSGEGAESSSIERLECWIAGFDMWRENPLFGVGQGQFIEHHFLTAHNSLMLVAAELGPLGLVIWSAAIFAAFKILVRATIDFSGRPEAAEAHTWAVALLSSMAAMAVSAFFLSVAYHPVVWIFLGLVAAYYAAARTHDPSWEVTFTWRDLVFVSGFDVAIMIAMLVYLKIKAP